jgi:integrase
LGWSETTANEYRITLLRIFQLAIDNNLLTVNPATKAKRYKLQNMRTRELSASEEERLRKSIRAKYPSKEPEFDLALHVGCRASNLYGIHRAGRKPMAGLTWEDVNWDWKLVTFPRSKNGASYQVPLNQVALDALKVLLKRATDGTGPVIRKPSGIELYSGRKWFENCLKDAAITNFRWHDLRHTFATRLRRAGVSIEDIRVLLGHGAKSITERYAHADMTTLAAAVAKLVPVPVTLVVPTQKPAQPVLAFAARNAR